MHEVSHPDLVKLKWLGYALSPFGDKNWVVDNIPTEQNDWKFLIMAGSQLLVLPSLYKALSRERMLSKIPKDICEALEGFYVLNNARNQALRNQVLELTQLLNANNIIPIWLKGATNLIREDWILNSNMMIDLDFWIPDEGQYATVLKLLADDGYRTIEDYPDKNYVNHHHFAPRFKDSYPASVEFHRHICETDFDDLLNDRLAINRIELFQFKETTVGQLCSIDRLMNSYLQCIHFHGNLNIEEHERLLTRIISFRKTYDFLERFSDASDVVRGEFFHRLNSSNNCDDSRKFFSVLSVFFGLDANIEIDEFFLQSIYFSTENHRFLYGKYILNKILSYAANGRLGSASGWRKKISQHLAKLNSRV